MGGRDFSSKSASWVFGKLPCKQENVELEVVAGSRSSILRGRLVVMDDDPSSPIISRGVVRVDPPVRRWSWYIHIYMVEYPASFMEKIERTDVLAIHQNAPIAAGKNVPNAEIPETIFPHAHFSPRATLTPPNEHIVNVKLSLHLPSPPFSRALLSNPPNSCNILTSTYPASVNAYCCPKQILGPPLNGKYSHPGLKVSHLSGLNSSASAP